MNNAFNNVYPYNPYISSYQMAQSAQYQAPLQSCNTGNGSGITFVNGIEGAKGYQLPPNSTVILMDSENSKFYVKTTNNVGLASIEGYKFEKDTVEDKSDIYVKKSDINKYIDEYLKLARGTGYVKSNNEDDAV